MVVSLFTKLLILVLQKKENEWHCSKYEKSISASRKLSHDVEMQAADGGLVKPQLDSTELELSPLEDICLRKCYISDCWTLKNR